MFWKLELILSSCDYHVNKFYCLYTLVIEIVIKPSTFAVMNLYGNHEERPIKSTSDSGQYPFVTVV
jgi:hypothetical protein